MRLGNGVLHSDSGVIDLHPYIAGTEESQSLKRNKSEHKNGISEKIKSGFNGESALQDESCSSGEKSTDIETDENFGKRSESSNRIEYGKNQEKWNDKPLQNAKRKLKNRFIKRPFPAVSQMY